MAKKSQAKDHIPQILSIVPLLKGGKISLKKGVKTYLGNADSLFFNAQAEILLTTVETPSSTPAECTTRHLHLPDAILASLELAKGDLLALIQRDGAVALKKLEVLERASDRTRIVDCETPHKVERVAEINPMLDVYPLHMPIHFQGCEVITTRAMSKVRDPEMRRFAEAHLWRYASRQHAPDGAFAREKHGYCENSQSALLQVFALFDHPASKVAIMRSLPWIVESQNEDGSWGEDPIKDATTVAVLSALRLVRDELPPDLLP